MDPNVGKGDEANAEHQLRGKPGWRLVDYQLKGQNCKASTLGTLVR